ncbi:MAG: tetratricopeptide repeat protein [Sedimentisphaerales bacterium]|jgi:tetratricopeptide (TPR) repeat protein
MREVQTVKSVKSKVAAFTVIVAAVAAVLYIPILSADFVYDDISQILTDNYIHTPAHFAEVLSLSVMKKDVLDNNRPAMVLSLMFDSLLWGRSPFGYHLTNLLLHSLNSAFVFLLIYGVLSRLFAQNNKNIGPFSAAFIGAIIFAIHPVNSEAVCVVTYREDLLAAFFVLLMLIFAEYFPTQRKATNLLLGGLIAILSFLAAATKENGAVAPVLLIVYWLLIRKAEQWRIWAKLICASFTATLVFMIARFTLVPAKSAIFFLKASYLGGSFSQMLTIQPRIWAFQLLELLGLNLLCADQTDYSIRFITLSAALVILAAIIVAAGLISRKNTGFGAGILFFCLAMLPTSNLIPIFRPLADRYLYLPMVGVCLALGAGLCRLKMPEKLLPKALCVIIPAAVCVFLGYYTVQREFVWHNSLSLWNDTVKKNPFSFIGNNNLGFALFDVGEYKKAIPAFTKASQIAPNEADAIAGLAITYDALGLTDSADQAYRKAVSLDKHYIGYDSLMPALIWTPQDAKKLQIIADRVVKK